LSVIKLSDFSLNTFHTMLFPFSAPKAAQKRSVDISETRCGFSFVNCRRWAIVLVISQRIKRSPFALGMLIYWPKVMSHRKRSARAPPLWALSIRMALSWAPTLAPPKDPLSPTRTAPKFTISRITYSK